MHPGRSARISKGQVNYPGTWTAEYLCAVNYHMEGTTDNLRWSSYKDIIEEGLKREYYDHLRDTGLGIKQQMATTSEIGTTQLVDENLAKVNIMNAVQIDLVESFLEDALCELYSVIDNLRAQAYLTDEYPH